MFTKGVGLSLVLMPTLLRMFPGSGPVLGADTCATACSQEGDLSLGVGLSLGLMPTLLRMFPGKAVCVNFAESVVEHRLRFAAKGLYSVIQRGKGQTHCWWGDMANKRRDEQKE
ncbi:hypothetical protein Bbelb_428960 [Branchiostoma belcheri]|nr:hypothetical protein Bbelb_428960 [Branchiostoma belcheri]